MKEVLTSFLIALVTSVAVLFTLGPMMMKLNGIDANRLSQTVPAASSAPAAEAEPTAAPAAAPAPSATAAQETAPSVEGMSVKEARERWRDQGILIIEDRTRVDSTKAPGTILEQTPSAGAVLEQKELRVIVAVEAELKSVPNVVGQPGDDARSQLEEAGFEVPEFVTRNSEEKAGTVLGQEPEPGTKSEKGAVVRITVSAELIKVPKLRNKRVAQARKELEKLGLALGKVVEREDEEMSGGRILSQKPKAGEPVEPGSTVDLTIVAPD